MDRSEAGPEGGHRRRFSITNLQRAEAAVAELISLCQTATADGTLNDDEISGLRDWLSENASLDIPARDYLLRTVQDILEDGVVTPGERKALFLAIEMVLPADVRADVRGARRTREEDERGQRREERHKAEAVARDLRAADRPVASWTFMVAGVRQDGRAEVIRQHASPGDPVVVCREPGNLYSANACQIRLRNDLQIGYVPEEHASSIAAALDAGQWYAASIAKILTGGHAPIPVVQLELYEFRAARQDRARATVVASTLATPRDRDQGPAAEPAVTKHRAGCSSRTAAALAGLAALAWLVA